MEVTKKCVIYTQCSWKMSRLATNLHFAAEWLRCSANLQVLQAARGNFPRIHLFFHGQLHSLMTHGIQMHINLEMGVSRPLCQHVFWIARPSVWRLTLRRRGMSTSKSLVSFFFPLFFFSLYTTLISIFTPRACLSRLFSPNLRRFSLLFTIPFPSHTPARPSSPSVFFSSLLFHASFLCLIAAGWNLLIPPQLSIPPIQCYCSLALFNYPSVDLTRQRRLGGLFGLSITTTRLWTDTKQSAPGMMRQKAVRRCWCELEVTEKWLQSNMAIHCCFPPSFPRL